ncbi:MAG: hypothetical protein JXX28_00800 [Deltaproteobacteria bacterium]|nr:hypothetical protein [Deltaproteobacteria bacterium]
MTRLALVALPLLLVGCVRVESSFSTTVAAEGVTQIFSRVERGGFEYQGSQMLDDFLVYGVSSGTASSRARAEEKATGNLWDVSAVDDTLQVMAESLDRGSVRFKIDGPDMLDTDIEVEDGNVRLEDLTGFHYVTAERIDMDGIVGDVDIYSHSGGIDVELLDVWSSVIIDSRDGGVDIWLPYGLEYDLEVWGDPDYALTVEDLGFDDSYIGEGYFAGDAGRSNVEVTLKVLGGSVGVYRSY